MKIIICPPRFKESPTKRVVITQTALKDILT